MARPKKCRRICSLPEANEFAPKGISNGEINVTLDEYEVIRQIDNLGLTHEECAKQMEVARTTITTIYDNARKKIADAMINCKVIKVDGGDIEICDNCADCCGSCGKNKCGKCNHGTCEKCTGVCLESGSSCFEA